MFEPQQTEDSNVCKIAQKMSQFLCNQTKILHIAQDFDILRKKVLKNKPKYTIIKHGKICLALDNCILS